MYNKREHGLPYHIKSLQIEFKLNNHALRLSLFDKTDQVVLFGLDDSKIRSITNLLLK